jgi:hypothetical protein
MCQKIEDVTKPREGICIAPEIVITFTLKKQIVIISTQNIFQETSLFNPKHYTCNVNQM